MKPKIIATDAPVNSGGKPSYISEKCAGGSFSRPLSGLDSFQSESAVLNSIPLKSAAPPAAATDTTAAPPAAAAAAAPADTASTPTLLLTQEQLQAAISSAIAQSNEDRDTRIDSLEAELAAAEKNRTALESVFSTLTQTVPSLNTRLASNRDAMPGILRDFESALASAPVRQWYNRSTGEQFAQRDLSQAKRLFFTERSALRQDMETYARRHGLLGGIATDAPTVRPDIPSMLLDYLSLTLRETHSGRYIFWQFPFYGLELGKGPGDTIQVARFRWLPEAAAEADRTLTPGTSLVATSQPVIATALSIVLGERGLGKDATAQPVAVPEFWMAYSLLSLENAVMSRLGHDYEAWEDISIRSKYLATTRVVYNDRGSITTVPANVGAGDDGTLSENFLNNLYAYMSGLQIPPLDDGYYCLAVNDYALAQLKNSVSARFRYLEPMNIADLTGILQSASNREMGRTSGYAGDIGCFHIFSTNSMSMGIAGTEGVQLETLGVGSILTRASLAFGRAAVARAVGMEPEMRRDNNDDFGRSNRWVWLSHETAAALDVDPALAAEQQLRVVEIRTTDTVL